MGEKTDEKSMENLKNLEAGEIPMVQGLGYNKISINLNNFSMEIISPFCPIQEMQSVLNFYLLLHLDEDFKDQWKKVSRDKTKQDLEKINKVDDIK